MLRVIPKLLIVILNILTVFIFFVQNVLVVRLINIEDYGKLSVVFAFIAFIQNVFGMRTGELLLRYATIEEKENILGYLKKIFFIDFRVNVLLLFVAIIIGFLLKDVLNMNFYYIVALSPIFLLSTGIQVFESFFILIGDVLLQYKVRFITSIVSFSLISFITFVYGIYGYIFSFLLSTFIKNVIYVFFTLKKIQALKIPIIFHKEVELQNVLSFSFYSYLSTTFKAGVGNIDILLLSSKFHPHDVALYKVAKNLSMISGVILGAFWQSLSPRILELTKKQRFLELKKMINKYVFINILSFIFIAPVLFVSSKNIISFLYGKEYGQSYISFIILFSGFWISYSFGAYGRLYYLARDKMHVMVALNGFTFFFILITGMFFLKSVNSMALFVSIGLVVPSICLYLSLMRH